MKHRFLPTILLSTLVALTWSAIAQAALQTQVVEYRQGDTVLEGYLAYDDDFEGARPGVMVVHEWMGIGEYVRQRVEQLAQMGYVAFAADIYGQGVRPSTPEAAGAEASKYRADRGLLRDRAQAGLSILQNHALTQPDKVAAIGYCFGGGTVLELARSGADVAGVVSFHGNLDTPNPLDAQNIQAKVLVLHGAVDPYVPPEQVAAFEAEMTEANVDWQLISYGGVVHSFTNPEAGDDPSDGVAYDAQADRRSWTAMQQFFQALFEEGTESRN